MKQALKMLSKQPVRYLNKKVQAFGVFDDKEGKNIGIRYWLQLIFIYLN